jgi:2-iminobutanoate/2-iminopropanoate deaminase
VVVSGDLVAIASQVPFDDQNHLVGTEFAPQAHQVFANLRRCLDAAGCGVRDVIKVTGYLARADLVAEYNDIYRQYFSPPYPARTTVACSLVVPGMLIQVDALARRPDTT